VALPSKRQPGATLNEAHFEYFLIADLLDISANHLRRMCFSLRRMPKPAEVPHRIAVETGDEWVRKLASGF